MAYDESAKKITRIAGAALTIYRFVKTNNAGKVITADAQGEVVDGVCYEEGIVLDDNVPIAIPNGAVVMAEAAAAVAIGSLITTQTDGRFMVAATGDYICGRYMGTAAAAAGEVHPIQFFQAGRVA